MTEILVCKPEYFDVSYKINPWMEPDKNQVDKSLAIQQWESLISKLKEVGVEVLEMPGQPNLPDLVFTANAALIFDVKKALISNFKFPERQPEAEHYQKFLKEYGYECIHTLSPFEGAGDALFFKEILIAGHGFRSCMAAYQDFPDAMLVNLVDPYFYHLDTCFCPLMNNDYLIWPEAFHPISLAMIRSLGGNELAVPEKEAKFFACNAVQVDKNVIIPAGCPETVSLLEKNGYTAHSVDMSEYLKSGGACKCLTLKLN